MRIASSSWKTRLGLTCLGLGLVFNSLSAVGAQGGSSGRHMVAPPETPIQLRDSVGIRLVETTNLIRAGEARTRFGVSGAGLAVAVIDSGLRTTHLDFAGRVVAQRNFTQDNGGDPTNATDGNGHGTHVTGVVAAGGKHEGIAPDAKIAALKVLDNDNGGDFRDVELALDYVLQNRVALNLSVVNISMSDGGNYTGGPYDSLANKIQQLRDANVAVVVSAGNDFFPHGSRQGMGYPAVFRNTVSAGAVYDGNRGGFNYHSGAKAFSTGPSRITPFSQRLHSSVGGENATDVFAPGAPMTSSGITGDNASAVMQGTSQAAPVTAGVILLLQEYHLRLRGSLPTVDRLEAWIKAGAAPITDGDDEDDNVANTGLGFLRLDAVGALEAMQREVATGFSISGAVRENGVGVGAVTLVAGDNSVTTAADGSYRFVDLPAGAYTVRATKAGYTFTPATRTVSVGPSAAGADFTGVSQPILTGVSVNPGTLEAQRSAFGGLTFSRSVPRTTLVTLTSSHPQFVKLPRAARIRKNRSTGRFRIRTMPPPAPTAVTIRATANGVTQETVLTVIP